jgi:hypothetical protein
MARYGDAFVLAQLNLPTKSVACWSDTGTLIQGMDHPKMRPSR